MLLHHSRLLREGTHLTQTLVLPAVPQGGTHLPQASVTQQHFIIVYGIEGQCHKATQNMSLQCFLEAFHHFG